MPSTSSPPELLLLQSFLGRIRPGGHEDWTHSPFFFFLRLIYFWEREREKCAHMSGRGRESPAEFCAEHRAWCRARSHNTEITTWAKTKNRMLGRLRHPGAPEHPLDPLKHQSEWAHLAVFCGLSTSSFIKWVIFSKWSVMIYHSGHSSKLKTWNT